VSQVFVSYDRNSRALAEAVVEDIQALGHTVWFDKELTGGQLWWDRILANIRGCDVFVYVLTPHSLNSIACQREHGYAAALGKTVLPVLMSEGVSTTLLLPALAQLQFVDYRRRDRDTAFSLARAFATLPPVAPLPDHLPAPPEVPLSYLGGVAQRLATALSLSYEEQSALLLDLKVSLRDPATAEDARTLLHEFRKRHDLLAAIADEIDAMLEPARPMASQDEADPLLAAEADHRSATTTHPVPIQSVHAPTPRERLRSTLVGAALGAAVGIAFVVARRGAFISFGPAPGIEGTIVGAIAGAIVGGRRTVLVASIAGSVLGWSTAVLLLGSPASDAVYFGGMLGAAPSAILAAIAAVIYLKLRRRPAERNAKKAASA
jgi:hypothetical protein